MNCGADLYLDGELVTEYTTLAGMTEVKPYSFAGCTSIEKITLGRDIIAVGAYAFADCTSLKEINWGEAVCTVKPYAFSGCTGLETVLIPGGLYVFEYNVFYKCTGLVSVVLRGASALGSNMFEKCTSLEAVVIDSSITKIGSYMFRDCDKIAYVLYTGTSTEWENVTVETAYNGSIGKAKVYYYLSTEPDEVGNYWRYEDGIPTVWPEYVDPSSEA